MFSMYLRTSKELVQFQEQISKTNLEDILTPQQVIFV